MTAPAATISVTVTDSGAPLPVVRLTGDLDDSVVPALLDVLLAAAADDALQIDATEVRTWEELSLRTFVTARRYLDTQGCRVEVVGIRWNQVVDLLLRIPLHEVAGVAALVRELQRPPRRRPGR